jgi:hypothetical protein
VLTHLAECDECGALFGAVIDSEPVRPDAAPPAPFLVRRAYRTYRDGVPVSRWRLRPLALAGLGTAAMILLAVLLPSVRDMSNPDRTATDVRGTSLQPLAPIGRVEPPLAFRWSSPVRASRYTVEIRDESRTLVLLLSSKDERVNLPREDLRRLVPGRAYSWEVIAFDAANTELIRGPARTFVVSTGR